MSAHNASGAPAPAQGAFGAGNAYRPDSKIEKTLATLSATAEGARERLALMTDEFVRAQRAHRAENVLGMLLRDDWHDRAIRLAAMWNLARWAHRAAGSDGAGLKFVLERLAALSAECPRQEPAARHLRETILTVLQKETGQ